MKHITAQKARAICDREQLHFGKLKKGTIHRLRSGAKLDWTAAQGYRIIGQADELVPYNSPHGIVLNKVPTAEMLRYAGVKHPRMSCDVHLEDGRVSKTPDGKYIIWCPDGVQRHTAWQRSNIERLATFGVKAEPHRRK